MTRKIKLWTRNGRLKLKTYSKKSKNIMQKGKHVLVISTSQPFVSDTYRFNYCHLICKRGQFRARSLGYIYPT